MRAVSLGPQPLMTFGTRDDVRTRTSLSAGPHLPPPRQTALQNNEKKCLLRYEYPSIIPTAC